MKKIGKTIWMIVIIFIIITSGVVYGNLLDENTLVKDNIKRDLLVLMIAYSEYINTIEKNQDGKIYILMNNGKKILYDDCSIKSIEDKFFKPDLQDILEEYYPLDNISKVMEENRDPGRGRHYGLLGSVYGESRESIEKNLINIDTYYGTVMFNKSNGAATNLKRALDEIVILEKSSPKINEFVTPISDTYNYKIIQDTNLLSPHSYGIAIDLNKNDSDYWKLSSREKGDARIKSYPKEIVQIFEKYGFVWGGKWSHFDILHFEYKPEIILKAKYFENSNNEEKKNWYDGIPREQKINNFITLIDKVINE